MSVKINYGILGKAIFRVLKPILFGLSVGLVALAAILGFVVIFGELAPVAVFATSILSIFGMLIKNNYDDLMRTHRRNQQDLVDILKK
jgi:CBS domain containing-hemolysin-like protein